MRLALGKAIRSEPDFDLCGEAASAGEALQLIPLYWPDIILVDVSLPGTDGIALVRQILKRWPDMRVVVVSGYHEPSYADAARQAGALDYVVKGDIARLIEAIRRAVN